MFVLETVVWPGTRNQTSFFPFQHGSIAICMQCADGNQPWCPGQSLWSLIAEHITGSELPKIQTALGNSLVNQYRDMHAEAEMWYKLLQESQQGGNRSRTGTPHQPLSPLADPPAVKELLRAEVKMLLQNLREKASSEGRDGEKLMFRYKPETVDYALNHPVGSHRMGSSSGDSENRSRPGSHCSVQSAAEDEIEAVRDKLNIADIDQVVDRLRSVLVEECRELNRLIKHLKGLIKQICRGQKSEPTLSELRELRGAIQKDLKLYPSSCASSPRPSSILPSKDWKNLRLPAGKGVSVETLQPPSAVLRPRPPSPLCQTVPRPPPTASSTKTSASSKRPNRSLLSGVHGQHTGASASPTPEITKTPLCNKISSSGHVSGHSNCSFSGSASDKTKVKITQPSQRAAAESVSDGLDCRTPSHSSGFQTNSARGSMVHKPHLSSDCSPGKKCDLFPRRGEDGNNRLACGPKNIGALSPRCSTSSHSSNSTDRSVSATRKSKRQNSTSAPVGMV